LLDACMGLHGSFEPLRDQDGEIARNELSELLRCLEVLVRGSRIGSEDAQQRSEGRFAIRARLLDVQEPRHTGRESILVLETRYLLAGRYPAVALPVDADEHLALFEVGAVEILRRVRAGADLEQHGSQLQPFDRRACSRALGPELLQRRRHEDAQSLVRGQDS